jgi:DNA-binding GntR family transcriptional regulator
LTTWIANGNINIQTSTRSSGFRSEAVVARRDGAATLSAGVLSRLRKEILDGDLTPGLRLKPAELGQRFDVSVSVVREALTRLVEQGLATSDPNRGFQVVTVSTSQIQDLTELRITVEQLALKWAIERGDVAWESEVIAAHHRLLATPRRDNLHPTSTTEEWAIAHREFHHILIRAAGFGEVVDLCSRLFDSAELYRRWSAPASGNQRDVDGEHTDLMRAVLARDTERAHVMLRDHYRLTAELVLTHGLLDYQHEHIASTDSPPPTALGARR